MSILDYWQPILLSAVLVQIASTLVWTVLPWHKSDYRKLDNEDAARAAMKGTPPGTYLVPYCTEMSDLKKPDVQEKYKEGPVAYVTVDRPGLPVIGPKMLIIFVYYLFIGSLCAYVLRHFSNPGMDYLQIFQLTGTVAWAAYGLAYVQDSIWFAKPWSTTVKNIFDALIYALLTGGAFGWLAA